MIKRIDNTADVWKAILTLMVIYIHSFSLVPSDDGTWLYNIKVYLSFVFPRIAVPLFFMYSGYFFFKGKEFSFQVWLGKMKIRLKTLLIPFCLWSLIGAAFFMCIAKGQRTFSFFEMLNHVFWMYSDTTSSHLPQWVGYEIPKVTSLNMPLWYVRDLILLMCVSPLIYTILRRKVLGIFMLVSLLLIFLFIDTDKIPYVGIDCLLFFMSGAFLSYQDQDVLMIRRVTKMMLFLLVIITSIWSLLNYGHQYETLSRHLYILVAIIFLLSLSLPVRIRVEFDKLHLVGGGKMFFVYCSHIMILRMLVFVTYRLTIMMPTYTHVIIYLMSPIVCFGICVLLYDVLQKVNPRFLSILVGNRLK